MKVDLAPGWKTELEQGPDWLFVKLYGPDGRTADASGLAETLFLLMYQDLVSRIVLELDGLTALPSDFLREILDLQELLDRDGGVLRICGLCPRFEGALQRRDVARRLTPFRTRNEAVLGLYRPNRPR